MLKKIGLFCLLQSCVFDVSAKVTCEGKIKEIVKWSENHTYDLSILLEGTNRYIQFTDETFKSMVLTAFAAQKTVKVRWLSENITSCTDGWSHYSKLDGYLVVLP